MVERHLNFAGVIIEFLPLSIGSAGKAVYVKFKLNIRVSLYKVIKNVPFVVQCDSSLSVPAPMPTSSTRLSLPCPSSPAGGTSTPGADGHQDEVGDAVWKRRYLALQESVNTEKSSKRKSQ